MEAAGVQDILSRLELQELLKRSDVLAAVGLVSILMITIIPLPSILLDLLLAANFTIALLILIISLYAVKAVEFSIFPSILLTTTLFRLALNVASTRLILLHGDEGPSAAGAVIQSFGQIVVGGNYAVGLVIFAILVPINFLVITKGAGFVIEVLQKGMPISVTDQNYTVLTVGDGLVSQIPALIISTSAGMLVTRSSGKQDFGNDLQDQFSKNSIAIWVVSAILLIFAFIPGLPFLPFVLLSISLGIFAYKLDRRDKLAEIVAQEVALPDTPQPREENYEEMLHIDLLQLEVGYGLIPFVDAAQDGELLTRIQSIRKQFALNNGFIVPPVHIKDNLQLSPNGYSLSLKGVPMAEAEIHPGHYMAMDPGMVTETIKGIATTEPTLGLPAIWISEDKRDRAQLAGYTVVDCATVMTTHISEVIKNHAHELIGRQEVQGLLDNLAKHYPKLVEELVPNAISLGAVLRVLQNLLKEGVSIRDLRTILETMADWAPATQDTDILTEYVRHSLARSISSQLASDATIAFITLSKEIEDTIQGSIQHKETGSFLAIDPITAQKILDAIGKTIPLFDGGSRPTLLAAPQISPHVRSLTERSYTALTVISHNEITPNLNVRSIGTVTLNAS